MGILARTGALAANLPHLIQPQIEAWTTSSLEPVVWSDLLGPGVDAPLTRAAAMRVPAVARARHLICGTIAKLPLEALRGDEVVPDQPYWMYGTDGQAGEWSAARLTASGITAQSPWWRMLWTVDDHLFHGMSVWLITRRNAPDPGGRALPSRMLRIPYAAWDLDTEGRIVDPDGKPYPPADVIVIPGPHEGILTFGATTIRQAADLEQTASDVARRPFRLELHQTTDVTLDAVERREIVDETRRALADNNGVLFTNSAIETKTHALNSDALLIGGRNAAALNIARDVSMPAALIDATTEGASLEYATLVGRNAQWVDYGISLYTEAITSRLGMDDILPAGQRAAYDMADLTAPAASPTGAPTRD